MNVLVFDDLDEDGVRDLDEGGIAGASVCVPPEGPLAGRIPGCHSTDHSGRVSIGGLREGSLHILVHGPSASTGRLGPQLTVPASVTAGVTTDVEVAYEPLGVADRAVLGGDPVEFTVCHDDPSWVLPPFEANYTPGEFDIFGVDESRARAIHARRVHAMVQGWNESQVWGRVVGIGRNGTPKGCPYVMWGNHNSGEVVVDLVGYEPLEITRDDGITQLRVRETGGGLRSVDFTPSADEFVYGETPSGHTPSPSSTKTTISCSAASLATANTYPNQPQPPAAAARSSPTPRSSPLAPLCPAGRVSTARSTRVRAWSPPCAGGRDPTLR